MVLNTGMSRAEAKDAVLEQVLQERALHGVSGKLRFSADLGKNGILIGALGPYIADVICRLFRNEE
jgi:hypothetical protein